MKKPGADDISNLFKQFGGQADRYQEIAQANEARLSRERWPLLNAIGSDRVPSPPPVPSATAPAAPKTPLPPTSPPSSSSPSATATRSAPRPFLSADRLQTQTESSLAAFRSSNPASVRREPSLSPPPAQAPSASPLLSRYAATEHAVPQDDSPPPVAQPENVKVPSGSLTKLFNKLEATVETPEPAASPSSLFRRLSKT